jgi:two-component system KDP operon response regulator KdpE
MHYEVELAASAEEAEERIVLTSPDAMLLDPALPDRPGLELCQQLWEWSDLPVIVISANRVTESRVTALDLGVEDYVTKPFGHEELLARLRAVLRRRPRTATTPVLGKGPLRLDQARRQLTRDGYAVHVTPTEYEVLRYLMANANKTIAHQTLLSAVWGEECSEAFATLRVIINQLRRKIEPDTKRPAFILTVPRVGYRFADPEANPE